jgi:hypothetical protein
MDALDVWPAAEAGRRRASLASKGPILPGAFRLRCAGMRPDIVRLGSVPGKTGVVGHRLLVLGAGWIVFRQGAPCRRQVGEAKSNRCGARIHRQLRSLAPVRLETSDTIFDIAASISASVRVRSRGCRITWMAIDFDPSGRPSP